MEAPNGVLNVCTLEMGIVVITFKTSDDFHVERWFLNAGCWFSS